MQEARRYMHINIPHIKKPAAATAPSKSLCQTLFPNMLENGTPQNCCSTCCSSCLPTKPTQAYHVAIAGHLSLGHNDRRRLPNKHRFPSCRPRYTPVSLLPSPARCARCTPTARVAGMAVGSRRLGRCSRDAWGLRCHARHAMTSMYQVLRVLSCQA